MQVLKAALFLLAVIISLGISAQTTVKNYSAEWKKIDDLIEKKNLPRSALTEVKKLYALAKKENQRAQVVKALIYLSEVQEQIRENNTIASLNDFNKEISSSSEPVTSLLHSLVAELYLKYYNEHRWQIYNRTQTTGFNKDDIATWSPEDFHSAISRHFLASVSNKAVLQSTLLAPFNAIIIRGNVRHLRPTLYDLLAHKALEYFINDEREIHKPADAFEIDQPEAFAPAREFIRARFNTNDTSSLHHKALTIYQDILAFHLNDSKPDALIDADIHRLNFVHRHSTNPDKDTLYYKALEQIAQRYGELPAASIAWFMLAQMHHNAGEAYTPYGDTTKRYEKIKAVRILERIIAQKDSSEGKVHAINLMNRIREPEFSFELEKVNVPGSPFRSMVHYKNLQSVQFRIVKENAQLAELINFYEDDAWTRLLSAPALKTWRQQIPATNDYQTHHVEIRIDALEPGAYFLIATDDAFNLKSELAAQRFYVSNISFINQNADHFVLHRETGQPLGGAKVEVWRNIYDYQRGRYKRELEQTFTPDQNGFFRIPEKTTDQQKRRGYENSYFLNVSWQDDRLFMRDAIYEQYYYRGMHEENTRPSVFFFTDRSIYRPGQQVFFKGIVINRRKENNNAIVAGFNTKIFLRDGNGHVQDSLQVSTNEFGSFNGRFQLPASLLNGSFSIFSRDLSGQQDFSVEEYKRPNFQVEFNKLEREFKLNDTVSVTATAKAYAGNNITDATVSYRVVRQPRFLYPWLFRWGWFPPAPPMEIAHGTAKTDAEGKFTVRFRAIPDRSIDPKFEPVFDYVVYADVTDVAGETRSAEKTITIGYKSVQVQAMLPPGAEINELDTLKISTLNMSGEYIQVPVSVSFWKLKDEQRLIRPRYWQRPDQFVMSKSEYIQLFPHDEYDNENDPASWERTALSWRKESLSDSLGRFITGAMSLQPGWYSVEIAAKDKDGNEVKQVNYIQLLAANQGNVDGYLFTSKPEATLPGEKTRISVGSEASQVFLVQSRIDGKQNREPDQMVSSYTFHSLSNEKKNFEFNISERDRGGFGIQFFFVKHNRFHFADHVIRVPWSNKQLDISYGSFRDKTLPGSREEWTITISGEKKDKVAAEMLASLYDASLDQFRMHQWNIPGVWPEFGYLFRWNSISNFAAVQSNENPNQEPDTKNLDKRYDRLMGFRGAIFGYRMRNAVEAARAPGIQVDMTEEKQSNFQFVTNGDGVDDSIARGGDAQLPDPDIQPRRNLQETAFFYPALRTDANGNISFSFTIPEALTKWKLQLLAHTKDLAFGYASETIITQKPLMVQPNLPRFLREGDELEVTARIVNMSEKEFSGQAQLLLFDATNNQPVDGWFRSMFPVQHFTVAPGQTEAVNFPIYVPFNFNKALVWRVVARADNFSDGEEQTIPVLTNRMLVTETLPLHTRTAGTHQFTFDKLLKADASLNSTLRHHALTVEYSSNPAWYAVQALPYLMEYPYDCAEQVWNRYYANALASHIVQSIPRIRQVFEKWKNLDSSALLSNLQKNQELKSVLLEETPWVMQAKSEEEQKKNIALLFDLVRMNNELSASLDKLRQMQSPNGGFVWFKGGPDDRFITQYIITGIGHLRKLTGGIRNDAQATALESMVQRAMNYLDQKIREDYQQLQKNKVDLKTQQPDYIQVQYIYMRSFFPNHAVAKDAVAARDYFTRQARTFWMKQNKLSQAMIALAMHRQKDQTTARAIILSLEEASMYHEELGRFYKEYENRGWFWFQAPVETQSLVIEAFDEIDTDDVVVDELKTWLLKNKQTTHWRTTKATAEACYALLVSGSDWLASEQSVEVVVGATTITGDKEDGTGYFKKTIDGNFIRPGMGNVKVIVNTDVNQNAVPSWGAVYWQYFEDLDKIEKAATPLQLDKKLTVVELTDRGPVLKPVNEGDQLNVGDKVRVRIELRVDRDMEYVHMKDLRASTMEPVNVLSEYKWQGGLGYYETTKDASTNFFINYLRKGTYVFEYDLFVTTKGNFSNGVTTIQCMYAPEFMSHSEGVRVRVE